MELLPCPFCGGSNKTDHAENCYLKLFMKTLFEGGDFYSNPLAEAWNRRASPASVQEGTELSAPTILPDGSGFGILSLPLPKDHWLYAEREYEDGAIEPKDLPAPILTHSFRRQVIAAIRYAVRSATNCGKEDDFDPDALVQNAVYALCGPYGKAAPTPPVSEDRWLPIETAPKETTQMFVVVAFGAKVGATPYNSDPWCVWHQRGEFVRWPHKFSPTHWMPLPEAPTMQEDKP